MEKLPYDKDQLSSWFRANYEVPAYVPVFDRVRPFTEDESNMAGNALWVPNEHYWVHVQGTPLDWEVRVRQYIRKKGIKMTIPEGFNNVVDVYEFDGEMQVDMHCHPGAPGLPNDFERSNAHTRRNTYTPPRPMRGL
jgi:hypothetical protein